MMGLQKGQVVYSLRGRDKGRFLVVLREEYGLVWLADGKERPLDRPKGKNPRHIRATNTVVDHLATNKEIRKALAAFGPGEEIL